MEDKEPMQVNPAEGVKLTDWKNEPDLRVLKEDLEAAKPHHDEWVMKVRDWRDMMKATGKYAAPKVKGRSSMQPKMVRRQAEWRYSALSEPFLSSKQLYSISPVTFEDADAARQNQLVINNQFKTKINRVKFVDEFVRTNVDEGSCIVRVGWKRVMKTEKVMVPTFNFIEPESEEQVQQMEAAILLREENPRMYEENVPDEIKAAVQLFEEEGILAVAIPGEPREELVEKPVFNHPTLDMISPDNCFFDPSCGTDFEKATFVVISFETSKAELKKEGKRYKNLDRVDWESTSINIEPDHRPKSTDQNFNFKDGLRRRVVAYEYWGLYDIHGNGELHPIVATWIGNVIIRMELNPYPDNKPPFIISNYMPVKREALGEPDAELIGDNQQIAGALTRGMIDLMGRSANSQQGFAKGMLDPLNRRKFENGQDYEFNPSQPIQNGFIEHKYPEIPQSAMLMLNLQNQEAEALTGVKSFSGGLSGEGYGDVAAGIRGVLDAASKREMGILRRLADALTQIGRKFISMNQQFLSEQETVRITNTEFVTVNREDLAGEFDLEVDISTAEVDNNKAQDLGFMIQTIGNTLDIGITTLMLCEIARLKRMPELEHAIRTFKPEPDPMQVKLQELEVARLETEIAKLQSEINLNNAKAEESKVKADAIDLDTAEQETGTKHARDMEKQVAQSTGNQNLEVTKGLLKGRKPDEIGGNVEAAIGWNEISKPRSEQGSRPSPVAPPSPVGTVMDREMAIADNPALSIGSQEFDPSLDPALNPAIQM